MIWFKLGILARCLENCGSFLEWIFHAFIHAQLKPVLVFIDINVNHLCSILLPQCNVVWFPWMYRSHCAWKKPSKIDATCLISRDIAGGWNLTFGSHHLCLLAPTDSPHNGNHGPGGHPGHYGLLEHGHVYDGRGCSRPTWPWPSSDEGIPVL